MNAAAVFVNPKATEKVDFSKKTMNSEKNVGGTSAFAKMLNGEVNKNEKVPQEKVGAPVTVANEKGASDQSVNPLDLLQAMEQLQELIPLDQGFIDPKLIEDPEVVALLNGMPPQMQQLLKDFIQSGQSFEYLLAQTEAGSKEQIGLLLLTLYQLEKKGQVPDGMKQLEFMKLLQRQVNEVFNIQVPEKEVQNASILLSKLNELLVKKNTTNSIETIMPNKLELRQAIQRVLYSPSSNENAGNQDANKELTDISNTGTDVKITQAVGNEDAFDQLVASSLRDGGSVNRIQQYVLNVGQAASGSTLPEDQILEQLQNIMKQSKFSTSPNGTSQLMIKLNPAHLGTLTIKLTESNGEMIARIIASSKTAKEVIESNLNSLRQVFTTQNITVEKFDIQYQGEGQFEDANKESNQQGEHSKRKQQEEMNQDKNDEDDSETISFKDELVNIMV